MKKNTTKFEESELLLLPKRDVRVFIGTESSSCPVKSSRMTVGLTTVPPKTAMIPHSHDTQEEIIFVLEGSGEVEIDGVTEPLEPFTAAIFPLGLLHQVRNTGEGELKFVFMFNPVKSF